jgi:enoyl-CoA hydratase/carnithine racemase
MFDLRIEGPIARLSLNRPEARNAIPLGGWSELAKAAERAQADARVMILSGIKEGAFCAGADIGDFDNFRDQSSARSGFREAMRHGLDGLRDLAIPTIALIEGPCYGAGVALAMACDIRIAGAGGRFAITPAKLGISYPQEDVFRLVALVGPGQASRLLLSAGVIDAAEALRIGLIEILEESEAAAAADRLAQEIAANDAASLALLKRGIALATTGAVTDQVQAAGFDDLLGSESLTRRLAAHRQGRK